MAIMPARQLIYEANASTERVSTAVSAYANKISFSCFILRQRQAFGPSIYPIVLGIKSFVNKQQTNYATVIIICF